YCEERLQAIYVRRRSKSAAPGRSRSETLNSDTSPQLQQRNGTLAGADKKDGLAHAQKHTREAEEDKIDPKLSSQTYDIDARNPHAFSKSPKSAHSTPVARFRLIVWITVCLRRLLDQIIRMSGEKTLRSATELQWMAIYAEKHDANLAFNKHLFSRDRVNRTAIDTVILSASSLHTVGDEWKCQNRCTNPEQKDKFDHFRKAHDVFMVSEDNGEDLLSGLATSLTKRFVVQISDEKLKSKTERYNRPGNSKLLTGSFSGMDIWRSLKIPVKRTEKKIMSTSNKILLKPPSPFPNVQVNWPKKINVRLRKKG
ncbi:hypothetical protein PoB_006859900, partial [Plakobranchus ocellatus]